MKKLDLIGKHFGRWAVIERANSRQEGNHKSGYWLCRCGCGNLKEVRASNLSSGQSEGCGCKNKLKEGESQFNILLSEYRQRNAGKRGLTFDLNKEQFKALVFSNCYYCGAVPNQVRKRATANGICVYNGIDRLDNSKGYIISNCVSCCKLCNSMKSKLSKEDFLQHIKKIHKNMLEAE